MTNKNQNKTILLTGAAGFIGSHILNNLITNNYHVLAITRNPEHLPVHKRLRILKGLFYDPALLDTIDSTIDAIVHCAAIRGESSLSKQEYDKINVSGTEALLQFAQNRNIPRFIFISSAGVLGTVPKLQPATDKNPILADGKYHHSKWQAEQIVQKYHSTSLKTLILRPTTTYGTGDDGFISRMTVLVEKRRLVLPSKKFSIHLLSADALAELVYNIIEKDFFDGGAYLITDTDPVSLRALANLISKHLWGRSYPSYFFVPDYIFIIAKWILKVLARKQLLTSIELISANRVYDISSTIKNL